MKRISVLLAFLFVGVVISRPHIKSADEDDENKLHFLYFPTPEEQVELIYNDTRSLQASSLKPATKTIFLVDGFTSPAFTPMNQETKNNLNVIIVDWSAYSGYGHPIESPEQGLELYFKILFLEMPKAGSELADFIHFLSMNLNISYENVTLIGHSMGAHTCSATGRSSILKYNQTVGRIIALDPALQFSEFDATMRLRIGDADVVEIYNTNRGLAGDMYPASGDIAIYVNGGDNQPCEGGVIAPLCDSHGFSWKLYIYLAHNETIKACPCHGAMCQCKGCEFECGDDGISVGPHIPESARGSYHLKTGYLDW